MKKSRMGRPRKPKAERKTEELRIPVTPDQKALVYEAMALEKSDMAGWARSLLMNAAQAVIGRNKT